MEAKLKPAVISLAIKSIPVFLLLTLVGCEQPPATAPVTGQVTIDGEPLDFGFVVFQPAKGQPAKGEVGPGGEFALMSAKLGEGALIGPHRVSVYCYEGHSPAARAQQNGGNVSLGRSLIPAAYSRGGMSGLSAEVPPEGLADFKIELSSRGPGR